MATNESVALRGRLKVPLIWHRKADGQTDRRRCEYATRCRTPAELRRQRGVNADRRARCRSSGQVSRANKERKPKPVTCLREARQTASWLQLWEGWRVVGSGLEGEGGFLLPQWPLQLVYTQQGRTSGCVEEITPALIGEGF